MTEAPRKFELFLRKFTIGPFIESKIVLHTILETVGLFFLCFSAQLSHYLWRKPITNLNFFLRNFSRKNNCL